MQIDFHYAVTYVVARDAGFNHDDAQIVAYASQYVDDATSSGTVYFDNQAVYNRISSAHKMLDPRNTKELANHQVWMTFHFLPGNNNLSANQGSAISFIKKIVCYPNSHVAQDMIRGTILQKDRIYGLHRLGVAMHVYADTWAHQGFAGVLNDINEVEDTRETGSSGVFNSNIGYWLRDRLDDTIPPLGHGRANVFPDIPFLKWTYKNGAGTAIMRDNPADFQDAAEHMCRAMRRFIASDPDANAEGLSSNTKTKIVELLHTITKEKGNDRNEQWLKAIREGAFTSFGQAAIEDYNPRGNKSWKAQALGTSHDLPVHQYFPDFLKCDWKLFHDAILAHRFHVIHDILPRYGICAA
jgi:hypothetical protein